MRRKGGKQDASRELLDFLGPARKLFMHPDRAGIASRIFFLFFFSCPSPFHAQGKRQRGGGGCSICWRFDDLFHAAVPFHHSTELCRLPDGNHSRPL